MPIHVELVTQERRVFEEAEADMVIVPAVEGEMGVLPNHAPVLTTMTYGELVVRKGNAEEHFAIYGGVVDVRPDKVVVLADLAAASDEIDTERAEEARRRAQQMLSEGVPADQRAQALQQLRRAELDLKISRKMSASGGPRLRILDQDEEA